MTNQWIIKDPASPQRVEELLKEVKVSPTIASLLVQRGIYNFKEAEDFFRPNLSHVNDPFLFKQMVQAVQRLNQAILNKEKIILYGDYDVDGTTAVAIMLNVLKPIIDSIDFYIPDRYAEGYGLSQAGVNYAISQKIDVFITLDCGIRSVNLIQQLHESKVSVIVCDHHEPGESLPKAIILDPKVPNENYPFHGLSGAGVAMKLLEALFETNKWDKSPLYNQLDLLALSIAADIVPVIDENRVYAFHGLKQFNKATRPAFKSMLTAAKRTGEIKFNNLVFAIAPRINAAGRIRSGRTAVDVMLDIPHESINDLIKDIEQDNTTRKELDSKITEEALEQLRSESKERSVNVLYHASWHKGVVGIVASRVIEKFPLPTIILTENDGVLSGSARTFGDFDLHKALTELDEFLIQYGGHKHAAGLSLHLENFEKFKFAFDNKAAEYFETHPRTPAIAIDKELNLMEIFNNESPWRIPRLVRILEQFEPFGPGNPRPVFLCNEVYAKDRRLLKGDHLKLKLIQADSTFSIDGIGFNLGEKLEYTADGLPFNLVFTIEINEFNNQSMVQLSLKDLQ